MKIPLTQGQIAFIDDEDYPLISQFKWYAHKDWGHWHSTFYAKTTIKKNGKIFIYSMHRLILQAQKGQKIDHKDRNGLNNCKNNLRFANTSQNNANAIKRKGTSSKYKGVCWAKREKRWMVRIKNICIGYFINEQEAAVAYDMRAKRLFGEFARPNF